MASLQARHHPDCARSAANKKGARIWTFKKAEQTASAEKKQGCTCPRNEGPVYHLHYRDPARTRDGQHRSDVVYEKVGANLEHAKRALRELEDRLDEEKRLARLGARPRERKDATFSEWSGMWFEGLTCKPNTKRSYVSTLRFARETFSDRIVRTLDVGDVREFLAHIRKENPKASDSTQAKHLRVLSACLGAAVPEYATENPVPQLHRTVRPRPAAEFVPSYFTDAELKRLWPALPGEMPAAVFKFLCQSAVMTGMRLGELVALRWTDVQLLDREVLVRRSFVEGKGADGQPIGETTPKSGRTRTVDLTPGAAAVLEAWAKLSAVEPDSTGLVFPNAAGGHLVASTVTRGILYPAMERAGIPRDGEHGRKRNFHSFRHSFARISLQGGAEMSWVQRQLGHSTITLTVDRYGRWERKAEKLQAQALGGAFAKVL
jgi:integrase